ncbi:MAG: hypothetical protein ACRDOI_37505 [Trebonia sp.]
MPSAGPDDVTRVVIDEASFDFRGLSCELIEEHLDIFNDTVQDLRRGGVIPRQPEGLGTFSCTDQFDLDAYLWDGPGEAIERDTRNRFAQLIQKCPEWDPSVPYGPDVLLGGEGPETAFSVAFALASIRQGRGVACLVFGGCERRGFLLVSDEKREADVFFFVVPDTLPDFWRGLYVLEKVGEAEFLKLAGRAFPKLTFNPDLTFRRFDGGYQDLLPGIVRHLAVLNDHFLHVYQACNGLPRDVEAALGAVGCPGISPESPKTRGSEPLMKLRDVIYQGRTVRCEWHTKIEPHRNRIHFAPEISDGTSGSKIFIGIFVDHLKT